MEIIFQGRYDNEDAIKTLMGMIRLLESRYQIKGFHEMSLSVTLLDAQGIDVELIDAETEQAFRVFEVYRQRDAVKRSEKPVIELVVDNSKT